MRNSLPIRLRRLLRPLGLAGLLAAGCGVALAQPQPSSPDPLVTDLSAHLIAITSNFTGTELLLFGSTEEPGDIVVVVRGPPHAMRVRLKSRFAGIWINRRSQQFDTVPAYYATTSSRPLQQIASPGLLTRLQIGADNLRFSPRRDIGEAELQPYREAIIRNKER